MTLRVRISTPETELVYPQVVRLRFRADDGWRGVLPGHEPARALLVEGALAVTRLGAEQPEWIASEAGVVVIDRREVSVVTRWALAGESLTKLREHVEARDLARETIEQEARALLRRHDLATRRALIALERRIGQP